MPASCNCQLCALRTGICTEAVTSFPFIEQDSWYWRQQAALTFHHQHGMSSQLNETEVCTRM